MSEVAKIYGDVLDVPDKHLIPSGLGRLNIAQQVRGMTLLDMCCINLSSLFVPFLFLPPYFNRSARLPPITATTHYKSPSFSAVELGI